MVTGTTPENTSTVTALKTQLDDGEAEAIALALELDNVFIILDDLSARQIALQLSLKVTGTVGMLLRAKQKGVIDEITPLFAALGKADFCISDAIIQKALQLAGEQA